MKIKNTIIITLITVFLTSCFVESGTKGSGNVTTEQIKIPDSFTGIKTSAAVNVILTQNDTFSISSEMDDNLHELLQVSVENEILTITFSEKIYDTKARKIYVSLPVLTSLRCSSASSVHSTNTFDIEELNIETSSASTINIDVDANTINVVSSSASNVNIEGSTVDLSLNASSASTINTLSLSAENIDAEASSAADIKAFTSDTIFAKASSGASIICEGNPEKTTVKESSGGSVSFN